MTTKERLTLSAYQKFVQHGRFPFKFVVHVLLLVFSTAQIMLWNYEDGGYYRSSNRNWQYWFLYRASYDSQCDLFTYDEMTKSVNATVHSFYNIDALSVDSYRTHVWGSKIPDAVDQDQTDPNYLNNRPPTSIFYEAPAAHGIDNLPSFDSTSTTSNSSNARHPPVLEYTYYKDPASLFDYTVKVPSLATSTQRYLINTSYLGPFDVATLTPNQLIANINRLQTATLTLHLDSFLFGTVYRSCLEWIVEVR